MFARDIRYPSKIIVSHADTEFNIIKKINKFKLRHFTEINSFTVTIKYVEHLKRKQILLLYCADKIYEIC